MSTGLADLGEISKAYRRTRRGEERESPRPRPKRDRINSFPITDDDIGHWVSTFPTRSGDLDRIKEGQRRWERGELHPDVVGLRPNPPMPTKSRPPDHPEYIRHRQKYEEDLKTFSDAAKRASGLRKPVPLRLAEPGRQPVYDYDKIYESNMYGGGMKHTISQRRAERAARASTPHGRRAFGRKGYIDRRGAQ